MAALFKVSRSTLVRRFGTVITRARAAGQAMVRRTLYDMATSGKNTVASMFWAKNHLGMSDVQTLQGPGGAPLPGASQSTVIVSMPENGRDPEVQRDIRERQGKLYGEATVAAATAAFGAGRPVAPDMSLIGKGHAGENGASPAKPVKPDDDDWGTMG